MNADDVLSALREHAFGLISGVPCSYLTPLINATIDCPKTRYINAANEGEAVAICSGAHLGGVSSVAMFQNSGLGNAVSPLTSLNAIFRIPVLLICTWRGQPGGPSDEPQHSLMGRIMPDLFNQMEIPYSRFPSDLGRLQQVLRTATTSMSKRGLPYALLLEKNTIDPRELKTNPPDRLSNRSRDFAGRPIALDVDSVLAAVIEGASIVDSALIATTGFTGRAVYNIADHDNHMYMVGSMGCVSSLALGTALAKPDRQVVAVDGDGALIMRMGALSAVAAAAPRNLTHVVLDNGVHDSTGAQATLAHSVDIPHVASACGYPQIHIAGSIEQLASLMRQPADQLRMIYVRTEPRGDRKLPRPTMQPNQVARRMTAWLNGRA